VGALPRGIAALCGRDIEVQALAEAADKRFVQVQVPGRTQEPMGRRKYWPIYEPCEEHGLKVFSHAFGSCGGIVDERVQERDRRTGVGDEAAQKVVRSLLSR
jgi:predicted TIM-barrel fold metal-dependent hydrolase